MAIYACKAKDGKKVFLVDTPGFDDTYKSDTDILREIASWLAEAYEVKIKLTGIIYLHRIMDVRMGGSGMKNLRMFKKLCGDNGLGSVVLATTMWSVGAESEQIERENQLKTEPGFWKGMIDRGSKVFRQDEGYESASRILDYLVQKNRRVTLDIQSDMIDKGLTLDQTAAGQEVQSELAKQREHYEKLLMRIKDDMSEALARRDAEHQEELEAWKTEIDEKMYKAEVDRRKLEAANDQLQEEMAREREEERKRAMEELLAKEKAIVQAEANNEFMKKQHKHVMEMAEIKFRLDMEKAEKASLQRQLDDRCVLM